MPSIKIFGRITFSDKKELTELLTNFFDPNNILACFESADDGCNNDHIHFVAETSRYNTLKTLRQSFSLKCYKTCSAKNAYSLKPYDPELLGENYICKGHKKDLTVKPDVFINTMKIDVNHHYEDFHNRQQEHKKSSNTRNTWKSIVSYIDTKDPLLLHTELTRKTQFRICSLMYDYYIENDKIVQGKYQQQNILRTIIAHSFKSREVKKQIILDWSDDFTYYSQGETKVSHDLELWDHDELL